MRKLWAGVVVATLTLVGLTPTADARTVKAKPAIVHEVDISGLLARIDVIRETGDSDDAVVLAFWLEGADTAEINRAVCIRHAETNPQYFGSGIGVVNSHGDSGPMQINRRTWEPVARAMGYTWDQVVWDPWVNALVATEVWWRAGYQFTDWSTLRRCR